MFCLLLGTQHFESTLQSAVVDDEAITDVALLHPLKCGVDVLDGNLLNLGDNVVLAAEIEHLLRLLDAADARAGDDLAAKNKRVRVDLIGDGANEAHHDKGAIEVEAVDVRGELMLNGNGVDDDVKVPLDSVHLRLVGGDDNLVGTHRLGLLLLAGGAGEEGHLGAEGVGELQAHVAEAAKANDANLGAFAHLVVDEGAPHGDAGTQEGGGRREVEAVGHAQDELLTDDDGLGVAAVGALCPVEVLVGNVISVSAGLAVLLDASSARLAALARVNHTADANLVAHLKLGYLGADGGDLADNFVAGDERVNAAAPVVAGTVQVAVADAAINNIDVYIIVEGGAAEDLHRGDRVRSALRTIGLNSDGS